jgi:MraZ protein
VFQGTSQLTLDAKYRVSMPTRMRELLQSVCESRLTLTRHPDGCLLVYPRPYWEAKSREVADLPLAARALQRLLMGSAQDVELDAAGRLLIPYELRAPAGLERDVALIGVGEFFELWDVARCSAKEEELLAGALAAVPEFKF